MKRNIKRNKQRLIFQQVRRALGLSTAALCMLPHLSFALGLGELRSHSHLGEPFNAEINLVNLPPNITPDNLLIRQVAVAEAKKLGVDIIANWQQIDFSLNTKSNSYQLRLNSRKPIREPYFNFLVEMESPTGKLYREYTVFLDPAPIAMQRQSNREAATQQASTPNAPTTTRVVANSKHSPIVESLYTVASGDTLSAIARRVAKSTGDFDSDWETSIFQSNPHAFINQSRNQLLAGVELHIPTAGSVAKAPTARQGSLNIVNANSAAAELKRSKLPKTQQVLASRVTSNQHQIDVLVAENRDLHDRIDQLEHSGYLTALQDTLAEQTRIIKQLKDELAQARLQTKAQSSKPVAEVAARATPAETDTLLANTNFLDPVPSSQAVSEKSWVMSFSSAALALLLAISSIRIFRSRKKTLASTDTPPISETSIESEYLPINYTANEQPTQSVEPASNDIDELFVGLELEESVKERLQEEFVSDTPSSTIQQAPETIQQDPEKAARDQAVKNQIKEKVDNYNGKDSQNTGTGVEVSEEIPIDSDLESYLKL